MNATAISTTTADDIGATTSAIEGLTSLIDGLNLIAAKSAERESAAALAVARTHYAGSSFKATPEAVAAWVPHKVAGTKGGYHLFASRPPASNRGITLDVYFGTTLLGNAWCIETARGIYAIGRTEAARGQTADLHAIVKARLTDARFSKLLRA